MNAHFMVDLKQLFSSIFIAKKDPTDKNVTIIQEKFKELPPEHLKNLQHISQNHPQPPNVLALVVT